MRISDRQLKFPTSPTAWGCCSTPKHPQQYAYAQDGNILVPADPDPSGKIAVKTVRVWWWR